MVLGAKSPSLKAPPPPPPTTTSYFTVFSTNVRASPKIFLPFTFCPFATLMLNFKVISSTSPKLLNLNQDHPSKRVFFWSSPCKIEVMITSLIEMLELPYFGRLTTPTIKFDSSDKIYLMT